MRSRNPGSDDCLDIQMETVSGRRDMRMRCQSEATVQSIIADIRNTVQVHKVPGSSNSNSWGLQRECKHGPGLLHRPSNTCRCSVVLCVPLCMTDGASNPHHLAHYMVSSC
eukprot:GHUV01037778.1.p3 GENE.GHUV01037778.1~~GHUV01037778.1.p3  ORF type:complete len:111 (-),score=16.76 GHUV01037778.1:151-483(-)